MTEVVGRGYTVDTARATSFPSLVTGICPLWTAGSPHIPPYVESPSDYLQIHTKTHVKLKSNLILCMLKNTSCINCNGLCNARENFSNSTIKYQLVERLCLHNIKF